MSQHRPLRTFRILALAAAAAGCFSLAACTSIDSSITPLRAEQVDAYWELVDDVPATTPSPATTPASAPATPAATNAVSDRPPAASTAVPSDRNTVPATSRAYPPDMWPTGSGEASATFTAPATATAPASEPATATAPEPAAAPVSAPLIYRGETPPPAPAGKKYVRRERPQDPNETRRYAYRVNYDYLFNHVQQSMVDMGFTIDRQDYRLGVIVSRPRFAAQFVEPWRPDQSGVKSAFESTMHSQRRTVRISVRRAPNPAFYEVAVQVLVDRETNPTEALSGAVTYGGREDMALARSPRTLRSDYRGVTDIPADAAAASQPAAKPPAPPLHWYPVGRDAALEAKILDAMFKGI